VLEVFPGERGAGGFGEQEIADPARFKPGQGEKTANNDRQAEGVPRFDQTQFRKPPSGCELDPLGVGL
jgi:hypothetical protein